MAATPQWINTPRLGFASLTTANTNRDGTGTIVDLLTGASGGTRILEIKVKGTGTVANCLINLFIFSSGSWRFFDDIQLVGTTPSTILVTSEAESTYKNLLIPSASEKLGAAITITPASAVNIFALGGDLA